MLISNNIGIGSTPGSGPPEVSMESQRPVTTAGTPASSREDATTDKNTKQEEQFAWMVFNLLLKLLGMDGGADEEGGDIGVPASGEGDGGGRGGGKPRRAGGGRRGGGPGSCEKPDRSRRPGGNDNPGECPRCGGDQNPNTEGNDADNTGIMKYFGMILSGLMGLAEHFSSSGTTDGGQV